MTSTTLPRHLDRLQDGSDALPRGSAHPAIPYTGGRPIGVGIPAEHEMFRVRTRPELYPDWMVAQIHEHRAALAARADMFDWDCHACQSSVFTHGITDPCPRCRTQRTYDAAGRF